MIKKQFNKTRAFVWRKFSRRGYAVFRSLGKVVTIGVLSTSALTFARPASATGTMAMGVGYTGDPESIGTPTDAGEDKIPWETDTAGLTIDDPVQLKEVEVATSRSPISAEKINRIVQIVDHKQITTSPAQTVNDLLKLVSGVDVRQRGAFGVQTDMCINGGTEDQVAIFINGMNMTNPQTGHGSFDPPLNPDDIERIEVIDGASSRIYGSQALSGAINIVTRTADRNTVGATLEGGMYGTLTANAHVTQASHRFRNRLSGGYARSEGADSNDDFKRGNVYWNGQYLSDKWRIMAQAGFNTIDFGANTFYGTGSDTQYEEWRRWLASAEARYTGPVNVMGRAYWTRMHDHYVWKRANPAAYQNFHRTDAYGGTANVSKRWRLGTTSLGGEVRRETIHSTNLGDDGRTSLNIYLEHNITIGRVGISMGAFGHCNSADDGGLHIYPGVDLSWQTTDRLRVFGSFNRSMRMPTFTDLHYNGPGIVGNAALKPEECSDFNVGASITAGPLALKAKGFYRRGSNMIDWVKYAGAEKFTSANSDIDIVGAELTAALNFGADKFVRNIGLSYCWLDKYRVHAEENARYESDLDFLRHKLVATLGHRIAGRLTAQWEMVLKDRRGWFDNATTGARQYYGTFATLDLKVQWTAPHYTLYVKATNLTGHRYYDYPNVLEPGLWALGGVKVSF